jgi:hypothetical protein
MQRTAIHRRTPFPFLALKTGRLNSLDSAAHRFVPGSLLQNCLQVIDCVRARLQSCRKRPIQKPALAAAELQIAEKQNRRG